MSIDTENIVDSQKLLSSGEDEKKTVCHVPEVQTRSTESSFFHKYNPSLKQLIPCRPAPHDKNIHPNDAAGLFSTISFSWLTTLILKTFKQPPTIDELWEMSEYDETQRNYERLSKLWEEELIQKGAHDASLWKVVLRFVRTRLIISTVVMFVFALALFFGSSVVVHSLLSYLSEENPSVQIGICLLVTLFCVQLIQSASGALHLAINYRSAVRCRAAMLLLVFKKALKMSPSSGSTTVGELVTMCSNDGDRIFEATHIGNMILFGPMVFFSGLIYTCYLMGPIGLVGPILFIATIPLQGALIKVVNKIRKKVIHSTQGRVVKINEILSSIKLIKMYSWEIPFYEVVTKLRQNELTKIKQYTYMYSLITSCAYLASLVASVVMISSYVLLGNSLTPEIAFTSIAIFNAMAYGLKFSPMAISYLADVNIALKRLKKFLILDSLTAYVTSHTSQDQNAVEIKDASFAWNLSLHIPKDLDVSTEDQTSKKVETKTLLELTEADVKGRGPVLKNINFFLQRGSLMGIYGSVGSGKSSLISGIMGQLQLLDGTVAVSGSVAYVAQQAWLMNATIRENIVFGLEFDKTKYDDVLSACELTKDLEIFSSGDLTEVGERGINLSGGQKQRISLARALYSDRDIYLLDDPLSAVDTHVGKSIFFEVILLRLKNKGKTVVLVTHQLQYLPHCDSVVKVENATITTTDSPDAVLNIVDGEMSAETSKDDLANENLQSFEGTVDEKVNDEKDKEAEGKLITEEEKGKVVGLSTFYAYTKAAGGLLAGCFIIMFYFLNVGILQFSYFWLSIWLKQGSGISTNISEGYNNSTQPMNVTTVPFQEKSGDILLNPDLYFYLIIYASSILAMLVVSVLRGYAYISMTARASHTLHQKLLHQVLHGTMAFFDTTPTGRILNRFQKDMDDIDTKIPGLVEYFMMHIVFVIFSAGLIVYVFPAFALALVVIVPIFIVIYIFFKPASREMKRLDLLTRSPWFSHISATISGLDTIRAYEKSNDFISKFCFLLDQNGEAFYLFKCVNRWLSFRLEILVTCIITVTAILVIFDKSLVSPAFAGLALSSALALSTMLQFTVRLLTEVEAHFVSTDRVKYYIENTDQETDEFSIKPDPKWPEKGEIEFQNVSLRYRDGLPFAIENLSLFFKEREKIGVVGRTGAGKSSLSVALFRLVELSQGKILIDNVDISKLSLHDLRSRLSIIPQDPVLFSGSVRYNLDPFNQYSESDVWCALEQAHMKEAITNLPDKLEHVVAENGSNFSVGERQLICLARALLRKSKVLILDEATAAVDGETEKIVHQVIDDLFSECTLITIAHRLSSVTSCDRVLVLDDGHVVEFDSPSKLLENKDSAFSDMISSFQSGLADQ